MKCSRFIMILALTLLFTVTILNAAEYVAFSLNVAQRTIVSTPKGKDYRDIHPDVFKLGGMTAVRGLVHDRRTGHIILVGERDPGRSPLTLDDFVVALRARFIHGQWPLVSIDPTQETKKTKMQVVRFEGGIERTQFGADLFDADYRLKRIGMGLLPSGVPGLQTYWDLIKRGVIERPASSSNIESRFWFYPVIPGVSVREEVVAIRGLKVGVFTEVLSAEIDGTKVEDLTAFQDPTGNRFAKAVSDQFEGLAGAHESFSRLRGLDELVALSKAIEEMDERPDLSFWLRYYTVKKVRTAVRVKVLKRRGKYRWRTGLGTHEGSCEVSGGVKLMAIALRLKAGDVRALKEAVLRTRPKPNTLSWSFVVGEWVIPTSPGMLKMEDVGSLLAQAVFLQEKERFSDAITLYGKIVELMPNNAEAYNNRGEAYRCNGQYDQAISDLSKAIKINARLAGAYTNRGSAYAEKGLYDLAILDNSRAMEMKPEFVQPYYNRGTIYYRKGDYDLAIADFNKAIELNPKHAKAYGNRGLVYAEGKGQHKRAINDFDMAIELDPRSAVAYNHRGAAYLCRGEHDLAIRDLNTAIKLNPEHAEAYTNLGIIYFRKGQHDLAIAKFNAAIKFDPRNPVGYNNRGLAYAEGKAEYGRAIADFSKAIGLSPQYADAYYNRGNAYSQGRGLHDQAVSDYSRAIEVDRKHANAYCNRGAAYVRKGNYAHAMDDLRKAIEIDPRHAMAHYNLGNVYYYEGSHNQARRSWKEALDLDPQGPAGRMALHNLRVLGRTGD